MTDENKKTDVSPPSASPAPRSSSRPDFEMNVLPQDSTKVMRYAGILTLAVVLVGGVIAVTPKVQEAAAQKERVKTLEAEIAEMKNKEQQSTVMNQRFAELQDKVQGIADKANMSDEVQDKLTQIESKVGQMVQQSSTLGLSGMIAKVQSMQQSSEGAGAIDSILRALASSNGEDIGESLQNLRTTDPAAAQLTEGVSPEDMKAAATLIAFTQMRQAMARDNDSFDLDLAILKKTLPANDQKLIDAIDRLAPQAKYGVLTPSGLSQEFKGLAGDIVSASLTGSDVSIQEKAKARLANVLKIEKDGQQISGTETQIAVAAAQKELDAGNIQGAMDILQTLKGPAAEKTQPFLQQAEASLLAGNLQTMLSQNIGQHFRAGVSGMMHPMPNGIVNPNGVSGIVNGIKNMMPTDLSPIVPSSTVTPVH